MLLQVLMELLSSGNSQFGDIVNLKRKRPDDGAYHRQKSNSRLLCDFDIYIESTDK